VDRVSGSAGSAERDQWTEIAAAARAHLAKLVELMPAMKPEEITSLMSAIDTAMWNEIRAATYDEAIEERQRSLSWGGNGG
jgi:hypothetical protein